MIKVLIIGGVAGGASAAARLRRLDEQAEIILFERGDYISFANCGLPYYVGGEIPDRKQLLLQTPETFRSRFNVEVRIHTEILAIDRAAHVVRALDKTTGLEYTESYDQLILSMGAKPLDGGIPGSELSGVYRLRNIPDADQLRKKVVTGNCHKAIVVGGSFIGLETAENLLHLGLEVTIVELGDHIIGPLDADMAREVEQYIQGLGMRLLLGSRLESITQRDNQLVATINGQEIETDLILLSIGVQPESALAKDCGLKLDQRGAIVVNEQLRTSDPTIFAIGDVILGKNSITGKPMYSPLAGPANKQGRIVADVICGISSSYQGSQGSAILKVQDLTIAVTGLNERTAQEIGLDYEKVYTYSPSHASYYPGGREISIKAIFDKRDGRLLGAQLVGFEGVDKRCDVFATAIAAGLTGSDLAKLDLCYAPPFSSAKDPVNMVGFIIENIQTGKIKQFYWNQVDSLPRDGSVTLLDVRSVQEVAMGSIDGFINIPLPELRKHLQELPKEKPVYVTCKSGLRAYIACRILSGNGFDCYNLAGGYRFYEINTNKYAGHAK